MPSGAYCRCGHYIVDEECPCTGYNEPMLYCKLHRIWYPEEEIHCPQCEWEAEKLYEDYGM